MAAANAWFDHARYAVEVRGGKRKREREKEPF
jgi:hypothetical protein